MATAPDGGAAAGRSAAIGSRQRSPRARLRLGVPGRWRSCTSAYFVLQAGATSRSRRTGTSSPRPPGNQDGFWAWVWEPNNEHRVPIAKLLYVALFQLWPDFRVGMIFNLAVMAGIAAAFVVFLRRMRGHTRWTDAFFPLVFLHLGNWENFGWSWELTFVIAAAVGAAILMLLALPGAWTTRRAALLVGCMLVTPFTGRDRAAVRRGGGRRAARAVRDARRPAADRAGRRRRADAPAQRAVLRRPAEVDLGAGRARAC